MRRLLICMRCQAEGIFMDMVTHRVPSLLYGKDVILQSGRDEHRWLPLSGVCQNPAGTVGHHFLEDLPICHTCTPNSILASVQRLKWGLLQQ